MRNLRSFFVNVFATRELSDDRLRQFTEVNLRRMAANNPGGALTARLAATTVAYDAFFGGIQDEATRTAIQQGLTLTMNAALEEFIRAVRRREGTIKSEFDRPSTVYEEFFPRGLSEYNQASLATVETLMDRFARAAARHAEVLGKPFAERFAALKVGFTAARAAQLTVMGEVKGVKVGTAEARTALEDELMDNLLTLAMRFKRQPEAGMAYFDQSILHPSGGPAAGADDPGGEPTPAVGLPSPAK